MENYLKPPTFMGFVLNIKRNSVNDFKKVLTRSFEGMLEGDLAYVFHPENNLFPQYTNESIGFLAKYKAPLDLNPSDALKKTLLALHTKNSRADKHIFLITEKNNENKQSIGFVIAKDTNTTWHICDFSESSLKDLADNDIVKYVHFKNLNELEGYINGIRRRR